MAKFETYEALFKVWVRWRSGPLKGCSPMAREILFTLLGEMAESPIRGDLVDAAGAPIPIGQVGTMFDCYQVFDDWPEGNGEGLFDFVEELSRLGFLDNTAAGVWFSPQMARGEI